MSQGEIGPVQGAGSKPERGDLVARVWKTLGKVYDPELGIDVVSMGLIYSVSHDAGIVHVEMTLTTPGCPASEDLPDLAQLALSVALGDDASVELETVWDPPWDPSMMNPDTALGLGP